MRTAKLLFLIALIVGIGAPVLNAQNCGGTERWGVKDGTDPLAPSIDLNPADATLITIDQLIQIDAPKGPQLPPAGDNETRLPDETHLYKIEARLVEWKEEAGETGDSDFHLVLTDDTLNYTTGRSGPTGHSFVGEIPDPQCSGGATGQFAGPSPFLPADGSAPLSIQNARSELLAQFPNAVTDGSWNDGGGIPVEIIGVGYFDFPHGQTGRAPNNIEIHPILSITFPGQANAFASSMRSAAAAPHAMMAAGGAHPAAAAEPVRGGWQYTALTADSAQKLITGANVLGAEGWEMISVVADTKRAGFYIGYLKRAK